MATPLASILEIIRESLTLSTVVAMVEIWSKPPGKLFCVDFDFEVDREDRGCGVKKYC